MNSATHTLTLFRRHEAACACSYPKEFRIYRHDSTKATQKKQCQCPISAEGTLLKTKLYVRSKGTGQREWSQTQAMADQWGEWGALQPPTGALVPVIERTTFVQAIEKFKATLPDDDTVLPFLVRRLIPFRRKENQLH